MAVQSVERIFSIIEILSNSAVPQQLSHVCSACDLAPSTVHRLLDTLCQLGYVRSDVGGYYSLTPKLFSMTSKAIKRSSLVAIAQPHLEVLSERVHESVHLVLHDGLDIVYVFKAVQTLGAIQMASHIGKRAPMYSTAAGKAILASLPEADVKAIFEASNVEYATPNTIVTLDALLRQLAQVCELGYAMDNEENELGITCVGMALNKMPSGAKYAFSVSSLTERYTKEHLEEVVEEMFVTKTHIENELANI